MKKILCSALAATIVLSGCAFSSKNVSSAHEVTPGSVICVTKDRANRRVAQNLLMQALEHRGITALETDTVRTGFEDQRCQFVLDAQSVSRWDMALYIESLDYTLYQNKKVIGRANFYAGSGLNLNKYNRSERIVNDLLRELFPNL